VAGQRYCLGCGARFGLRDPQLEELLWRMRAAGARRAGAPGTVGPAVSAVSAVSAAPAPAGRKARRTTGLRLPPPRVSAALVLICLGFGVIIGGVAGAPLQDTLAASSRGPLRVILPASAAPSVGSSKSGSPSLSAGGKPPAAESEPTPGGEGVPAPRSAGSGGAASGSGKSSAPAGAGRSGNGGAGGKEGKSPAPAAGSEPAAGKLPPVKHVFEIVLSDQPYAAVFGPSSPAPYLSRTLERKGELLVRYYAVAHQGLADGIALVSGQGPTPQTAQNCPTYEALAPGRRAADGQILGHGCVYPATTETLVGQLAAKHMPWRAYLEAMGEGPGAQAGGGPDGDCGHPAPGASDPSAATSPPAGQAYATWRNPFVYFSALTDAPACAADDVGLNELAGDLANPSRTPSFAYIVPDRCHDANPTPCAPGAPAGPAGAEPFLKRVVPKITGSSAYKEGGLLVITVDQAPSSGELADSSSCCGQPQFPNLPPSTTALTPEGGGQVGALLLSPFIKGGGVSQEPYNHFSLLRTIEDLFGLKHLGYAGLSKVSAFETSIFASK
jgi:hypothetical protein